MSAIIMVELINSNATFPLRLICSPHHPGVAPPIRAAGRLPRLVVLFAVTVLVLGAALLVAVSTSGATDIPEITIHFVDTGINFLGDSGQSPASPFADSNSIARLVIRMPSDFELQHESARQLQDGIENQMRDFINTKLKEGVTNFQVQLVENVSAVGYMSGQPHADPFAEEKPNRQDLAGRFGIAAYGALSQEVRELTNGRDRVSVYGTLGSNGTVLFARAVEAWKNTANYVGQVTYVDGRARSADVMRTADVLGGSKVRIIVNSRDLFAPSDVIANFDGAKAVQAAYPDVTVLLADRESGNLLDNHISSMVDRNAVFDVQQVFRDHTTDLGRMSAQDLHPFAPGSNLVGSATEPGPDHPTATDLQRLADDLDAAKAKLDLVSPVFHSDDFTRLNQIMDYGQKFADLSAAIKLDAEENRDSSSISSHTVQKLAEFGVDTYADPEGLEDLAKLGFMSDVMARRLGYFSFGASDIAGNVGTMAGGRPGDVEAVTGLADGALATVWGVIAYRLSGNWDVAQAAAVGSKMMAGQLRDLSLPVFEKFTGVDGKITALWENSQDLRAARGQSLIPIQEFYQWDKDVLDKVDKGDLTRANARFGLRNPAEPPTVEVIRRAHTAVQEVCERGVCTSTNLPFEPNSSAGGAAKPVGGIRLNAPLSGATLRGVTIDSSSGNIILLADHDFLARGLKLRDFAMALWLVFGPHPQDPAFSLDPADASNPSGPWLRARYMPELMQDRSFGAQLFAADLLLKELSFQAMLNPSGQLMEWKSKVPGFRSYAELAMEDSSANSGQEKQWSRFWIVADQVTSRRAGDTMLFDATMAVKARRQVPDPNSPTGLRDINTDPESLEARWARIATARFEELAAESPAFARVRQMAVAIAIAKSLKAAGVHVDLNRVADLLNADHTPTVAKINAFSLGWHRRSETPFREGDQQGVRIQTQELHLFGGVDLGVQPRSVSDHDGEARGMDHAVQTAFHLGGPRTEIVRFKYGGSRLEAVAVPLLVSNDTPKYSH